LDTETVFTSRGNGEGAPGGWFGRKTASKIIVQEQKEPKKKEGARWWAKERGDLFSTKPVDKKPHPRQ